MTILISKNVRNIIHATTATIFQQQTKQQQCKRLFNRIHQKFIKSGTHSFTNITNQNYAFQYQNQYQYQYQKQQIQYKRTHFTYSDGPGTYDNNNNDGSTSSEQQLTKLEHYWSTRNFNQRGFTVGIGGPVGSGKTALVLQLCQNLYYNSSSRSESNDNENNDSLPKQHNNTNLAVVTNDIFTQEDCEFLIKHNALPKERILAVETGGCPHAAIREDISSNLSSLEYLTKVHYQPNNNNSNDLHNQPILLLCESGGDNLAANFSRELADITIYVIDVAGGDKVPRKGGPGITQSDLLLINKIDLASAVGANLDIMKHDANIMRQYKTKLNTGSTTEETSTTIQYGPTYFCSIKNGIGIPEIIQFIQTNHQRALQVSLDYTNSQSQVQHSHTHDHSHDSNSTSSSHSHNHDHK